MDRIAYYAGSAGPIVRRLSSPTTGNYDIQPGDSFRLKIRHRDSDVVLLDKLMTADLVADTITYQPTTGDSPFEIEGTYRAWVYFATADQDTDEFEIITLAHAPGETTRISVIWRAARAMAPIAWDHLLKVPDYGDAELQRFIDLAKLRVLRVNLPVANEASLDPRIVDYIALKVLVDHVLEAAISYWTNQVVARTARQTDEIETYPDRIAAHERMLKRFREKLALQQSELEDVLGTASGAMAEAPALGGSAGDPITPGLETFTQPYRDAWPWETPTRW